ncbi:MULTISPECIES: M23 family metallopeptidase [Sphingobacterium]|uniref:M23 family metallopeptidase n=1 Tax=Sphingobacterium litopenaei TaxID=2763500 RepID=A0ABR7YF46_9SPHI|nr:MULTISPECIES: M23 family metallopeptidase [Sphingobacterium]MBD1429932.1 M23 family metallopeptidase [Sphingobacterium litopenaei]NGM74362.1 M23 family metallopeptidase [Sphingobacterium sp. SGL-16]
MFKKKSAIQISIEGIKEKSLEVPTILIKHWKEISLSALALIVALIGTIAYVAAIKKAEDVSAKYEAALEKIHQKNKKLNSTQLETQQDILEAKKSFMKIDSTIQSINGKMKKRGINTKLAFANTGGPTEIDEENIALLSEYYENLLANVEKKMASIPLGKPHNGAITSRFGYRVNPFTRRGREMHSGVDFRGRMGEPIRVTADGVVTFAGYEGEYGYVVKVKHQHGYETRYAHLVRTQVKKGQRVDVGTVVGLLGNTGRSTGPHLHYEILKDNKKINPEKYFEL